MALLWERVETWMMQLVGDSGEPGLVCFEISHRKGNYKLILCFEDESQPDGVHALEYSLDNAKYPCVLKTVRDAIEDSKKDR